MIETKPPQALSLYDLIAREWALSEPVTRVIFNSNHSAVACTLADGRLALLPVADAEHPEQRIRMELETGRTTIRPRNDALPTPRLTSPLSGDGVICRLGDQGFAMSGPGTTLWQVTAGGQTVRLAREGAAPVSALCLVGQGRVCIARQTRLSLVEPDGKTEVASIELPSAVRHLARAPGGEALAAWAEGQLFVLRADTLEIADTIAVTGEATGLAWSPDGRWIAAGCTDKALGLVDLSRGKSDRIVDFPAPVASAVFDAKSRMLVASGAFRVVGWRLPDLPFGSHEGEPIQTGKPGLTVVERIAANPVRETCAVGYANGLVTLCHPGQRDELMLCEGRGAPVTTLVWSDDGTHLALGFADGRAAIVTFPKAMFK